MRPEFVSFRIDEMLRQLEVEFAPLAREKGLDLKFVPCSLAVRSDRRLLRRLLQNLVSNAIKYTPKGRVLVGCRRSGGNLRIDVYDTGLGIPASKKQVIFREFQRLDEGAKVARGLGLGLSIVERIGRVLDHKVDLRSAPRRGSRFSVEVPLSSAAPSAQAPRELAAVDRGQLLGTTVLCIDNEPQGAGRHGDAARRLGLPGAEGAGPRHRHRRDRRIAGRAERAAGRLPSRPGQRPRRHRRVAPPVRRRPAGDPDHRRPLAARCATRRARRTCRC